MAQLPGEDFDLRRPRQHPLNVGLTDEQPAAWSSMSINSIAAVTAFECLPVPVLVISSSKTVVFANEAMNQLLRLNLDLEPSREGAKSANDTLQGQSISELGINVLQGGSPVRINWSEFLNSLVTERDLYALRKEDQPGSHARPSESGRKPLAQQSEASQLREPTSMDRVSRRRSTELASTTILDASFEVVISHQTHETLVSEQNKDRKQSVQKPLHANMIISIWMLDDSRYFTLTFTSATATNASSTSEVRPSTRTVIRSNTSQKGLVSSRRLSNSSPARRSTVSASVSPNWKPPSFPPNGPPNSTTDATHSVFQKATQLKDAILNSINMPAYALWEDESFGIPNQALIDLLPNNHRRECRDQREFLSQYRLWKEDFKTELTIDEFPIIELCRSQTGFANRRVGMQHPESGTRIIFDVTCQPILDEITGEFLGGIAIFKDVTEYTKRIAAQVKENERQFEYIANLIPIMVWRTTATGVHDWYSQRWYDYTGLTEEESYGEGWMQVFHKDDMPETEKRWLHSLATGEDYKTEYRCRRHDGHWRWMLGRAVPFRDNDGNIVKWFGTCTDIHDVVEARQAAKDTREQLKRVLEHAQATLWAVNREKEVTLLAGSMHWSADTDVSPDDAVGRPVDHLFGRTTMAQPVDQILDGKVDEESVESFDAFTGRWFRSRLLPLYSANNDTTGARSIEGVIGISLDVTELRKRDQELHEQEKENSALLANAAAAKEANRMKSQFLANMSHEIRTPIAGVIGMSELLLDTDLNEDQRECAENIQRSANSLLTVINDILDLSKVESGRLDVEEVQFNLTVVLRDVNKMLSYGAFKKGLAYETVIQDEIDNNFRVIGDPGRVRQILTNLVTNSIKFTSEGYVKMKASIIGESDDAVNVQFEVEDTGIGIEEEVRKKLFIPFSQADSSTARRFGGTGLGLTICKNLVELMHGKIELRSQLGRGTKAIFWIPFNKVEGSNDGSSFLDVMSLPDRLRSEISVSLSNADGESSTQATGSGINHKRVRSGQAQSFTSFSEDPLATAFEKRASIHILVVEDNQINQQIALRTIKKLGFSVSAVWNGQEALDYLSSSPSPERPSPALILMDCQMPVMDGLRATQIIRTQQPFASSEKVKNIPIVAMTASAIQGDKEKCQKAGMDDYLSKPVTGKVLENMLLKWATRGRKRSINKPRRAKSPEKGQVREIKEQEKVASPNIAPPLVAPDSSGSDPKSNHTPSSRMATELNSVDFSNDTAWAKSSESEDDRSKRRLNQEEKASSLRDDKLLSFGDAERSHHPSGRSNEAAKAEQRDTGPSQPLSYANLDRLEQQHYAEDHPGNQHQQLQALGRRSVKSSTADDFRSTAPSRPPLEHIRQHKSDRGVRTASWDQEGDKK